MDFCALLSSPLTLKELNVLRDEILIFPRHFDTVFELIFSQKPKTAWRAAWAVEKVSEKDTSFFSDKHTLRLMEVCLHAKESSLKRSVLAVLINLPLPENIPVEFINICFERMVSSKEAVAVQVLSMQMLKRIAEQEPDFAHEIIQTLENVDLTSFSAGYIAARRKVMRASC